MPLLVIRTVDPQGTIHSTPVVEPFEQYAGFASAAQVGAQEENVVDLVEEEERREKFELTVEQLEDKIIDYTANVRDYDLRILEECAKLKEVKAHVPAAVIQAQSFYKPKGSTVFEVSPHLMDPAAKAKAALKASGEGDGSGTLGAATIASPPAVESTIIPPKGSVADEMAQRAQQAILDAAEARKAQEAELEKAQLLATTTEEYQKATEDLEAARSVPTPDAPELDIPVLSPAKQKIRPSTSPALLPEVPPLVPLENLGTMEDAIDAAALLVDGGEGGIMAEMVKREREKKKGAADKDEMAEMEEKFGLFGDPKVVPEKTQLYIPDDMTELEKKFGLLGQNPDDVEEETVAKAMRESKQEYEKARGHVDEEIEQITGGSSGGWRCPS